MEGDSRYFNFAFVCGKVCPRGLIKIWSFSSQLLGILETAFFLHMTGHRSQECTAFNLIQDIGCVSYMTN